MKVKYSTSKAAESSGNVNNLPFYERYMLSVEETCLYFHIGEKKMRELVRKNEGAKWMVYSGKKVMIKKEMFSLWLDQQTEI